MAQYSTQKSIVSKRKAHMAGRLPSSIKERTHIVCTLSSNREMLCLSSAFEYCLLMWDVAYAGKCNGGILKAWSLPVACTAVACSVRIQGHSTLLLRLLWACLKWNPHSQSDRYPRKCELKCFGQLGAWP